MEALRQLTEYNNLYRTNVSDHGFVGDYEYSRFLPFEKVDAPAQVTLFLQRHWHHTVTISVVYFGIIKLIQYFMRDRKPFVLKTPLFLWNAALAVFSFFGFVRFSEDLFGGLRQHGLQHVLCYSCNPYGPAAFWSLLFAISKIIELGDTLFIVLRKRPLIFLHYYHHAAVLIYTIHSGAEHTAAGRIFITMNYFAHSCMYVYYAVMAAGFKVPRPIAMAVTSIQTTQMLAGVATTFAVYKLKVLDEAPCQQSIGNLYLAFFLYATFAVLFVRFFVNAYLRKGNKKAAITKKTE